MSDPVNVSRPWQFTAGLVGYYTAAQVDDLISAIPVTGTTSASVDLSKYAKAEDKEQWLLSRTITAQGFGFGDTLVPNVALTYTDTGEGYGSRLVLAVGETIEYLVYRSDLEPLNALFPRVDALEAAPPAATREWVAANFPGKDEVYTEAEADSLFAGKTATYTKTEADGLFAPKTFVATVYTKTQADSQFAAKATTYTKAESDNLFAAKSFTTTVYTKTQADTQFADKATTYTKLEVDAKIPSLAEYAKTASVPVIGAWLGAVPQSGSTGSVASRRIGDDMVQLQGSIMFAAPLASNTWTDIALLQSNARPAKDTNFVAVAMDGTGTPNLVSVWVYATGRVAVRNYAAITSVSFNHVMASR